MAPVTPFDIDDLRTCEELKTKLAEMEAWRGYADLVDRCEETIYKIKLELERREC